MMRKFAQLSLACVAAVAITACANDGNMDTTAGAPGATGTAGTAADIDRDFVADQLEDGDAEVRLGRLAEERATNADVKAFGRMMVEEHTMAGTDLKRIAGQHNITPDADDMDDVEDDFERLSKLEGADFDRAYIDMMVDEHEEAVNELEGKVNDNDEHADVKAWVTNTLPKIRQHLERAKQLRDALDARGNNM